MSLQAMRQALEFVEKLRVPQNVLQVMLQIQEGEFYPCEPNIFQMTYEAA